MELEFFCEPDTDLAFCILEELLPELAGLSDWKDEEVRYRDHDKEELSFYSKATTDVEFLFPFDGASLGNRRQNRLRPYSAPECIRTGSYLLR